MNKVDIAFQKIQHELQGKTEKLLPDFEIAPEAKTNHALTHRTQRTETLRPKVVSHLESIHGNHFHSIFSPKNVHTGHKDAFRFSLSQQMQQRCIIFVDENRKHKAPGHPQTPRLPIQHLYPQQ